MKLQYSSKIGWPLLLLLSFIPLIIWMLTPYSLDKRFMRAGVINYGLTMQALGQALGLVGMAMFALNLVLGARLRFLESIFGGMNKVYIVHHILGGLSFILLLLHPLFLVAQYLGGGVMAVRSSLISYVANPHCIAHVSLSNPECSYVYGVIALGLMILFLVLTFFVKLPYHIWKLTHKFLGVAFFFGALHVLFVPSDVTEVNILKYYMFFLVAIGFAAICYRTVLGMFLVPTREYNVDDVKQVNASIVEITMHAKDGKSMKYTPGQFIFIGFPDTQGLEEVHPFSISSAPDSSTISIGVKGLGDYTNKLHLLSSGARAVIEGPFGRTSYTYYPRKEQIWIAGGIGITPFLSMARSLTPLDGYKVDLYYSAQTLEDAAFDEELRTIASANPNLHFIPWYGKEKGFLSAEAINQESKNLLGKEIFICGPPPMMRSLKMQFGKWKVPVKNIHSEEFAMS